MSNLRDAIVRMALRRPYLYLLVTLVISIVLMEVLVEIAEHTFIKPALQQLELQFIAYVQQFVTPPLTAEVMLVTASGSSTFYLLASALVCCWYLYSRQKDRLYLYLVCLCGGGILNQVLKRILFLLRSAKGQIFSLLLLKVVTVFPAVTLWERFVFMAYWHILQD